MSSETHGSVIDPAEAQAQVDVFLAQTEQRAIDAGLEAGGIFAPDVAGAGSGTDHTASPDLYATVSADNDDLGNDLAEGARRRKAARAAAAAAAEAAVNRDGDEDDAFEPVEQSAATPDVVVGQVKERFGYRKELDGEFGGYTEEQWDELSADAQYEARIAAINASRRATQAELEASAGGSDQATGDPVGPDLEKDRRVIAGRESLRASTGSTKDVRTQERSAGTVAVFDEFGQPNFESPPVDRRDLRPISHVLRDAVRAANRRRKAAATERANNSRAPQETGADRTIPYDADLGANPEPVTNTSKVSMRERASRIFVAAGEGLQRLREKGPTELIRNGWARAGVISNNALNSTAERARSMRSGGREVRRDNSEHGNRARIILGAAIGAVLVGGAVYIAKHGVESPVHLPDMGDALHPRVGRGGNNHVVGEAMSRRSGSNLHRLQELTPGQTRHLSTEQLNDLQNMTQQQVEALKTPEFARLVARSEKLNQFVRDIHPNWPNARVNEQAQRLLIDELERASSSAS